MENFNKIRFSVLRFSFYSGQAFVLIYSSETDLVHISLLDHTDQEADSRCYLPENSDRLKW